MDDPMKLLKEARGILRECRGTLRVDQHDGHRRMAKKIEHTCARIDALLASGEQPEEAILIAYAPDGSSCQVDINNVSYYYENGKACDCEDCKRLGAEQLAKYPPKEPK